MNERLLALSVRSFDWSIAAPAMPEMILLAIAVGLIALDLFAPRQRQLLPWLTVLGVLAALGVNLGMVVPARPDAMLVNDSYAAFFGVLCLATVILTALMREMYADQVGAHQGEFYSLLVFSSVGMLVMASAVDLISIYLSRWR